MELRQLKYFLKAKEYLNFTEAANSLHITQSTLSQQIKQLEEELDIPLFNRIGKRITLTEAGELFSGYALQSINKANDGLHQLKDLKNLQMGKIKIGVTYALRHMLSKGLIKFAVQYPKIQFEIVFATSKELLNKLERFELDAILTFGEIPFDNNFKHEVLFTSPMTLVMSSGSELRRKKAVSLKEITSLPLALPAKGYSTAQFINTAFSKNGHHPEVAIEINDIPTLLELVKTGNWYTILTQTTVEHEKDLYSIPIQGKNMLRTAMIISLKEVYEKNALRAFLNILTNL